MRANDAALVNTPLAQVGCLRSGLVSGECLRPLLSIACLRFNIAVFFIILNLVPCYSIFFVVNTYSTYTSFSRANCSISQGHMNVSVTNRMCDEKKMYSIIIFIFVQNAIK